MNAKASIFEDRISRISKGAPLTGAYIEEKFAKAFLQADTSDAKSSEIFLDKILSIVEKCDDPIKALELASADVSHIGLNYIKVRHELRILKGAEMSIDNYSPKVIKDIKTVILDFRKALGSFKELEQTIKTKLPDQCYYNSQLARAVSALVAVEDTYPESADYLVDTYIEKLLAYNPSKIYTTGQSSEINPTVEAEILSKTIVSACESGTNLKAFVQKLYDVLAAEMISAQQSLDATIDRFSEINLTTLTERTNIDAKLHQKYDSALKEIQKISPAAREIGIIK